MERMVAPGEEPKETPEYPPYLLKKCVEEEKRIPPIYLACGEDDFLYDMNKEFLGLLNEYKVEVTWVSLPGYGHEWRFWNMQVEYRSEYSGQKEHDSDFSALVG